MSKDEVSVETLKQIADSGLALAQAYLAADLLLNNHNKSACYYADLSLLQNERVGFYVRGCCEQDKDRKIYFLTKAAQQGCFASKNYLETLLKPTDAYLWHL
jgi:hypothetical protein